MKHCAPSVETPFEERSIGEFGLHERELRLSLNGVNLRVEAKPELIQIAD